MQRWTTTLWWNIGNFHVFMTSKINFQLRSRRCWVISERCAKKEKKKKNFGTRTNVGKVSRAFPLAIFHQIIFFSCDFVCLPTIWISNEKTLKVDWIWREDDGGFYFVEVVSSIHVVILRICWYFHQCLPFFLFLFLFFASFAVSQGSHWYLLRLHDDVQDRWQGWKIVSDVMVTWKRILLLFSLCSWYMWKCSTELELSLSNKQDSDVFLLWQCCSAS